MADHDASPQDLKKLYEGLVHAAERQAHRLLIPGRRAGGKSIMRGTLTRIFEGSPLFEVHIRDDCTIIRCKTEKEKEDVD